mgnify:FL=1|jgi:putative phage-type endonuclease|tara:strand:- start:28 stop:642 length:615 start_codon:yes stop_codon:yes gene_type:complete
MQQLSTEWFAAKLGKISASRCSDIVATNKGKTAASRENYLIELILQRMTGKRDEGFTNAAMEHGIKTEAEARGVYGLTNNCEITQVAFLDHPTIPMAGASPDGIINDTNGMLEIKCPTQKTHMQYLLNKKIPRSYITQMNFQLACSPESEYVDFCSYDNRFPDHLQLLTIRHNRDSEAILELEKEVTLFSDELTERQQQLEKLK